MKYFDEFVSRNIVGEPTTEQIAVEEACRLFDGLADLVKAHESEINKVQIDEAAMEAANYSDTNKYPVFILLTKGHSPLSKIIFTMTGDEHSHASIAFGIKLTSIYSFGTKKLNPKREMGFVHISANSDTWGEIPTEYDLFVTFVDYAAKKKMMQTLEYFTTNSERLKYHWAGLVKIFFHIKTRNQKAFICSRFVAAILGAGGVGLSGTVRCIAHPNSVTLKMSNMSYLDPAFRIMTGKRLRGHWTKSRQNEIAARAFDSLSSINVSWDLAE